MYSYCRVHCMVHTVYSLMLEYYSLSESLNIYIYSIYNYLVS